jgi:hypothetical protein
MAPPSNIVDKFGILYNKVDYETAASGISLYGSPNNESPIQEGYVSERKDAQFVLLPGDVFHVKRKEKGLNTIVTSPPIHFLGAVWWRFETGRREIKWVVDFDGVPKVVVPRAAGFGNTSGIITTRVIVGSPSSAEDRAASFARAASFVASEASLLKPISRVTQAAAPAALPTIVEDDYEVIIRVLRL